MPEDVAQLEGPAEVEVSPEQKRSKVYRHADREKIEALLRRGKSAQWIALWLEEEYPLEDDRGKRHPDKRIHEKLQLRPKDIDAYRSAYMPQCSPGFDLLTGELEDAIGHHFPAPETPNFELALMEASVRASELTLARGLAADVELEVVQPTTLQAQAQLTETLVASADLKAQLGMPGYEPPPERIQVQQTSIGVSVDLQGQRDPQTGEIVAAEPDKVSVLRELMAQPPERMAEVLEAARALTAPRETGVNGEAGEVIESSATEIPEDEELDGGPGGDPGAGGGGQSGDPAGGL